MHEFDRDSGYEARHRDDRDDEADIGPDLDQLGYDGVTSDEVEDETEDGFIPEVPPEEALGGTPLDEARDPEEYLDRPDDNNAEAGQEGATQNDLAELHDKIRHTVSAITGEEAPRLGRGADYERPVREEQLPAEARRLLGKIPVGSGAEIVSYIEVGVAHGIRTSTKEETLRVERSLDAEIQFKRRELGSSTIRVVAVDYAAEHFVDAKKDERAYQTTRHISAYTTTADGQILDDEHRMTIATDPELLSGVRVSDKNEVLGIVDHLERSLSQP